LSEIPNCSSPTPPLNERLNLQGDLTADAHRRGPPFARELYYEDGDAETH